MRQTLHIFRKDARRCWPYIALTLLLTGALALLTPKWTPLYSSRAGGLSRTVDLLQILLPLTWWFTVAHLIHGESLVGDRQFWITRPYSWKSLWAAKLLFCAAFLTLPFLLSDCYILAANGFAAAIHPGSLLARQCSLAALWILPPFVLAALTQSLREFVPACLLLILALFALAFFNGTKPSNRIIDALTGANDSNISIWFVCAAIALLAWQFARRQTAVVRTLVASLFAVGLAWSAWPPPTIAPGTVAASPNYPEVAVAFTPGRRAGVTGTSGVTDKVQVDIPVAPIGRDRDQLEYQLASVRLTAPDGEVWSSPWNWSITAVQRLGTDWLELNLDQPVFERLSRSPVRLEALFGVVLYREEARTRLRLDADWASIPGFGSVRFIDNSGWPMVWWRAPLVYPTQKFVFTVSNGEAQKLCRGAWIGNWPAPESVQHVTPVAFAAVSCDGLMRPPSPLAKDAEAEFILERPLTLLRRNLQIPEIRLQDYVVPQR